MDRKNYNLRTNGVEHGTVYTSLTVVRFMLNEVGYISENNLSAVKILDPAAGDGAFLLEIINRLIQSSKKFDFNTKQSILNLRAVEIDKNAAARLRTNIKQLCGDHGIDINDADTKQIVIEEDFLLDIASKLHDNYDVIIGNPPYIRNEEIPEVKRLIYKKNFSTFRHRSDIYIAFYEKSLSLLSNSGNLCFICSNRWMKTKYGEPLRKLITEYHSLEAVIDINDPATFDQDVDAYASITLIAKQPSDRHYMYFETINSIDNLNPVGFDDESAINILPKPQNSEWRIGDKLSYSLHSSYRLIEEQGYKIGIGVASGADKVFIGENLPVEEEVKIPIVLAREVMNGEINWKNNYIFNPYSKEGTLIDLNKYPKTKQYLERHEDLLRRRHTARKNPGSWFKTIDRIYPDIINKPKLLIPDMKRDGLFPIDIGRFYPHHNIYYVTHPEIDMLKILGAFLISDFCKEQINLVSVKMRGGFSRWQSQNLRKVMLPEIQLLDDYAKTTLIKAYDKKDPTRVNEIVDEIVSNNL